MSPFKSFVMATSGSEKLWTKRPKALMAWSSGKDAAAALERILERGEVEIVGLLTTLRESDRRVNMHGVKETLVLAQAVELGLPWECVLVPSPCSNEAYESRMAAALRPWRERGVTHVIFGDLFLDDIRRYREERLSRWGMHALFPLWGEPTQLVFRDYLRRGMKARVTCIDRRVLSESWLGRPIDDSFLAELPANVDPCGENGEFHTFVEWTSAFSAPIVTEQRSIAHDGDYAWLDLTPKLLPIESALESPQ